MPELTKQQLEGVQVIEEHDKFMRVYEIQSFFDADENDPLTTIQLTGRFQDVLFEGTDMLATDSQKQTETGGGDHNE